LGVELLRVEFFVVKLLRVELLWVEFVGVELLAVELLRVELVGRFQGRTFGNPTFKGRALGVDI
jgi:hypothetical protein